jgi:hypothetical protein
MSNFINYHLRNPLNDDIKESIIEVIEHYYNEDTTKTLVWESVCGYCNIENYYYDECKSFFDIEYQKKDDNYVNCGIPYMEILRN